MGLFGGGNSSSSSSTTNNNYDNRQVITNDTSSYDLSDRSVNNSVSNTTTNTTTNITDGGAITAMAGATKGAYDYADHIFDAATVYANGVNKSGLDAFSMAASLSSDALSGTRTAYQDATKQVASAYGNAAAIQTDALTLANKSFISAANIQSDALSGAQSAFSEATKQVGNAWNSATDSIMAAFKTAQVASADAQAATQSAYADAKGTTGAQKQIIFAVLAVAAVMAFAAMKR